LQQPGHIRTLQPAISCLTRLPAQAKAPPWDSLRPVGFEKVNNPLRKRREFEANWIARSNAIENSSLYSLLQSNAWGVVHMRRLTKIAAAALLGLAFFGNAEAAFIGIPMNLGIQLEHIRFDTPTLAPMAHTRFCMEYPEDCKTRKIVFRGSRVTLNPQRVQDLIAVNAKVNSMIKPERNVSGIAGEKWIVGPSFGDCNDYAVTKRHELIARGWPAQSLLLAEVVTSWGEHHLVVVVRTKAVDLVIDNLNANIKPWTRTNYTWVRIQTPNNPMFWAKVGDRTA
jgi:predicted transglutaminase-like cysteine proteinase